MAPEGNPALDPRIQNLYRLMKESLRTVSFQQLVQRLKNSGIEERDPRLKEIKTMMAQLQEPGRKCLEDFHFDLSTFSKLIGIDSELMIASLLDNLVIPKFREFEEKVGNIFNECSFHVDGEKLIPDIGCAGDVRVGPDSWGAAICTVDGQRCYFGDHLKKFQMRALCKPFALGFALKELGLSTVRQYTDHFGNHEITGFLTLNHSEKMNPMLTSGFITTCCLLFGMIKSDCLADLHHRFFTFINDLAADEYNQMKTHAFLKAQQEGHRALAVSHFLAGLKVLPDNCDVKQGSDFYFEANSVDVNCESLSVMAATLAHCGINPLTKKKLIKQKFVKYILSLMYSSGMNHFSGLLPFEIGYPMKSGAHGGLILVIPGLLGMAVFSPRLTFDNISARGLYFCQRLVKQLELHPYQNLTFKLKRKFPKRKTVVTSCPHYCNLFSVVVKGQIEEFMKLTEDPAVAFIKDNYDRTVLHVAVSLGHLLVVKYLAERFSNLIFEKDKWGRSAMNYARAAEDLVIMSILKEWESFMTASKDV